MSIELNRINTLLKDVVILRLLKRPTGTISGLHLPDKHRVPLELIPGEVLKIGTKFRFKDEVEIGDIVWVPSQFGNAVNQLDEYVRFYDGEDCAAFQKVYKCYKCGIDVTNRHWMCDQDLLKKNNHWKVYCDACFSRHPCRARHPEDCATLVMESNE